MFACCFGGPGCELPFGWDQNPLPPFIPSYHRHRIIIESKKRKKFKMDFDDVMYTLCVAEKVSIGID